MSHISLNKAKEIYMFFVLLFFFSRVECPIGVALAGFSALP